MSIFNCKFHQLFGMRTKTIDEMFERFDETQQKLLARMDRMHDEFTRKLEKVSERFSGRPSWAIMFLLTALSSLCVGMMVYLIKT